MSTRRKSAVFIITLVAIATALFGCFNGCQTDGVVSRRAMAPSFPCSDVSLNNDPNNCGSCGTICGTFALNQPVNAHPPIGHSDSFRTELCAFNVCVGTQVNQGTFYMFDGGPSSISSYIADAGLVADVQTTQTVYGTPTIPIDCWDQGIGNIAGGGAPYNPVCINILNDSNNCGGLGVKCLGPCQRPIAQCQGTCADGGCSGSIINTQTPPLIHQPAAPWMLTDPNNCGGLGNRCVTPCLDAGPTLCGAPCSNGQCQGLLEAPAALSLRIINSALLRGVGGVPPYWYSYAPNGNGSGGTVNSTSGSYAPGLRPGVDVLEVFDSVGNHAIGIN